MSLQFFICNQNAVYFAVRMLLYTSVFQHLFINGTLQILKKFGGTPDTYLRHPCWESVLQTLMKQDNICFSLDTNFFGILELKCLGLDCIFNFINILVQNKVTCPLSIFINFITGVEYNFFNINYSQTCVQRPPLGPKICGRC